MKTVQKQYKNSTKTVNYFLDVRRGLFKKLQQIEYVIQLVQD